MKILKVGQIPSDFHKRLYGFLEGNLNSKFYNYDYYRKVAKFCNDNVVQLDIAEFLAFNFYFFSKSRAVLKSDVLRNYLLIEKEEYGLEFTNIHINRAEAIMGKLFTNVAGPSADKIHDLIHLFYGFNAAEFEQHIKAKMQDDCAGYEDFLELEDLVMSQMLAFTEKQKVFKTAKFQNVLEPFVQQNVSALLQNYERETAIFKRRKTFLN